MLILKGINNLLDQASALQYAEHFGYRGYVLPASGETGPKSIQVINAIHCIHIDCIHAIYGFSGGGYNTAHIIETLRRASDYEALAMLERIVIVGAPKLDVKRVTGNWELIIFPDPPTGHMDGPRALLESVKRNGPTT